MYSSPKSGVGDLSLLRAVPGTGAEEVEGLIDELRGCADDCTACVSVTGTVCLDL